MINAVRTKPAVRLAALLLAVATGVGGFWASLFILAQWDTLWTGTGYYTSNSYYQDLENRFDQARELAWLLQYKEWKESLPYLDQQRLEDLEALLRADQTNFRFAVRRNDTGTLIYTNGDANLPLDTQVHSVEREAVVPTLDQEPDLTDYITRTAANTPVLHVITEEQDLVFTPDNPSGAIRYGYIYNGLENNWEYDPVPDVRVLTSELVLEYGVTDPMKAQDEFLVGYQDYGEYASYLPALALLALALDCLFIAALVLLLRSAGWRRGAGGPARSGFDRIPLELLFLALGWAVVLMLSGGDAMTFGINQNGISRDLVVGLALLSCGVVLCLLAGLLTLAVRVKTHTLLSSTLIWMCFRLTVRCFRAMARSWPLTWRMVLVFLLYLLGSFLTGLTLFLVPIYQGAVLVGLCRWTLQWKAVQTGAGRILGGEPEYRIDTTHMYHDLAAHAQQLNGLGQAVNAAAEERIQNERFKAELITNVSHDLKTPLTSIINYVDLLKKQGLDSPDAPAYLEVLDRKSQRLKKLTEDLVEASKASTGSLSVHLEQLGMVQLFQQALGEFEERFAQSGLAVIPRFPPEDLWIMADGRHLWRVMDNLLSNCNKYTQPGTRIYADLFRREGRAVLTIKNVSRQQLNIPAEQLMERFVRGDESRSTEGSGLGLSIARSLTELQGGRFSIEIDGDLFKATLSFPEVPASTPGP
ncbi:sensor histidine kinase [uncultured Flavonifractor sp.]|uniref:sensor histidine kinase n=1 Tax=uncultured Flavonifractor sp. TaxID=1193534 RepID=UPI0026268420|nr:HAMP domain-containing sensor histidine kinase [uncultured Flavonifractor sp.]